MTSCGAKSLRAVLVLLLVPVYDVLGLVGDGVDCVLGLAGRLVRFALTLEPLVVRQVACRFLDAAFCLVRVHVPSLGRLDSDRAPCFRSANGDDRRTLGIRLKTTRSNPPRTDTRDTTPDAGNARHAHRHRLRVDLRRSRNSAAVSYFSPTNTHGLIRDPR